MTVSKRQKIPEGWEWRKLGDCVRLINGRAYSQHELLDAGTPVIRIQNLNGGDRWYYSDLDLPDEKYCTEGDLLFAWSASFGPYIWRGPRSIFHYHIWRVIPFDNLDKAFALHLLEWITESVKGASHGVAMLHMTKSGMESWEIPLPSLPEQHRIAAILDQADALRAKRREALAQLDSLTQSIFIEMFGDPVTYANRYKIVDLADVCTKITDGEHGTVERVESGRLYLMARNVTRKLTIDLSEVSFVSELDHQKIYRRCNPEPNDLLLVCVGATIGKVALVPDMEAFSLARSVALIKPKNDQINPFFLLHYFDSKHAQSMLIGQQNVAAQAGLYLSKIKGIKIPVPSLAEQLNFANIIAKIDEQKRIFNAQLASLEKFFSSLQHRAFRGEL